MKQFRIVPQITMYDNCGEFVQTTEIGLEDLVLTNRYIWEPYFGEMNCQTNLIFVEEYGTGEPSDEMVEKIYQDVKEISYRRVIAIGGGTIIDVSKLFALKQISPVLDLYDHVIPAEKEKELLILPTTCGTGSEVTNISILELKSRHTKLGLADEALYADQAVLVPDLLKGLPYKFFATSSIDALIHGIESYLSPKASPLTESYSLNAIRMILKGYQAIAKEGEEARMELLGEFALASTYAGIAFGNAGCAAVHAMSYPLGAVYHVPHGESNYAMFMGVMREYVRRKPEGKIAGLQAYFAEILDCGGQKAFAVLEELLNQIIPLKPLCEYGMKEEEIEIFTENVMTKQGRLMANNYVELDAGAVAGIYRELYRHNDK